MTIIPFPDIPQECGCRQPGWLSLPVAPQAAARTRFCGEDKLPQAVPLNGALTWIADLEARGNNIAGLDINGPGDPLATLSMMRDILTMLRDRYPEFPLGLTTLGLGLSGSCNELAERGVSKVTLLVDAVDPKVVQNLFTWIRPGKRNAPLAKSADILIEEQAKAITACKSAGIAVSILTTVYAGINEQEVEGIARKASSLGAEFLTLVPAKGWLNVEEKLPQLSVDSMEELVRKAGQYIATVCLQMPEPRGEIIPLSSAETLTIPQPTKDRPNVAVLSSNGMDIDLHLGQAIKAVIYGPREDGLACLLEARDLPEPGSGDNRWLQVAETLNDCFVLLAASAGQKPRDILDRHGLTLLLMEDNVEGTVDALYGGRKKGKCKK